MANTPAVDECLMTSPTSAGEKRGLPRNLHWIIIILVIVSLGVVIIGSAVDKEAANVERDAAQESEIRKAAVGIKNPVDPRSIEVIKNEQESTVPSIGHPMQHGKLPPVPDNEAKPQIKTNEELRQEAENLEELERKRQQREEAINSSPLLAIKGKEFMADETAAPATGSDADLLRLRNEAIAEANQRAAEATKLKQDLLARANSLQQNIKPENTDNNSRADANNRWLQQQEMMADGVPKISRSTQPSSHSVLMQGSIIPVALVTALNSDLPGQIVAQTTSDVYDSIKGTSLIIPRGSKLYGQYNADVRIGQERALAAFSRLIRPDGSYINLMGMPAADAMGQSGIEGDVNNHFFKMFGASFATAGLAALFDKSANKTVVVSGGSTGSVSGAAGDILVDVVRQINQRNTNIQPTITVPSGTRFVVTITKDIDIPPYRGRLPGQ